MNGVRTPTSGRVRRMLRRSVLLAAFTGAGWLLALIFAGGASATPEPAEPPIETPSVGEHPDTGHPSSPSASLIAPLAASADLLADTVNTLSESVASTLDAAIADLPTVFVPPPDEPVATMPELPQLLPVVDWSPPAIAAEAPVARVEPHTPATRAPPVTAKVTAEVTATKPEHTPGRPAPTSPGWQQPHHHPSSPPGDTGRTAAEHANTSPRPDNAPASLPGSGTTATTVHDTSGGARGTHGVLAVQATVEPSAAELSCRGRSTGIHGRITGLPATSPD
ncbi:hypothetical protein GCM10027436_53550 [Actinophytocola sediminis]